MARVSAALILIVFLFVPSDAPKAQEEGPMITPTASPMPREHKPAPRIQQSLPKQAELDSNEVTVLRDSFAGQYRKASLENLSKMYWRLGAFDMQDDEAISNYVKITDCKIYTNFVNDDMEWSKISNAVRTNLEKAKDTFPLNYQFLIEMNLGRYDPDRGGFPLINKTGFMAAKRIEVDSIDSRQEICYDSKAIDDYPRGIFILLPRPFTLDFVTLNEHVAQAYILRKKSEYANLPEEVRVKRYERDAYLRLRVSFQQYNGNIQTNGSSLMAILYGTIDGYEIFEDASEKRLMLSVDLTKNDQTFNSTAPTSFLMSVPTQQSIVAAEQTAPKEKERYVPGSFGMSPNAGNAAVPVSHSFAP